jgi:hypothetical protein
MSVPFDPGYGDEPFRTLVEEVPGATVFPLKDFRTEWGPVFHRGRLDGSARWAGRGQPFASFYFATARYLSLYDGRRRQRAEKIDHALPSLRIGSKQ